MKKISKVFWQLVLVVVVFFVLALYKISLIQPYIPPSPYVPSVSQIQESNLVTVEETKAEASSSESSQITQVGLQKNLFVKTWHWMSTLTESGKVSAPRSSKDFTLTFKTDKTFFVTTDCNSVEGIYATNDSKLSMKITKTTNIYCENSQESDFTQMLTDAISYKFSKEGDLTLSIKEGTLTLK